MCSECSALFPQDRALSASSCYVRTKPKIVLSDLQLSWLELPRHPKWLACSTQSRTGVCIANLGRHANLPQTTNENIGEHGMRMISIARA